MGNQQIIGVDVGNSSIKSAEFLIEGTGELRRWKSFEELVEYYGESSFVIVTVGGEIPELRDSWVLRKDAILPIEMDYGTPETLGLDRVAAAVGAWTLFPNTDLIVIDSGSCITYDLVTNDGVFQGGVISPGLEMRYRAMHEFTDGLPLLNHKESGVRVPGKTTEECMRLGAEQGMRFEIEGFLKTFNKNLSELQVVTTGGLLPSFDSRLKKPIFASSKIVLDGLRAIWKLNEET